MEQMNEQHMTPMPRYRSHKEVWALKIAAVDRTSVCGHHTIEPADAGFAPFLVDEAYMRKHDPQPGGYFVVYDDGYKSFSPAKAFEEGYTRLGASAGSHAAPAKGSDEPLTVDEHRARHVLLHQRLDELFADFISQHPNLAGTLDVPIRELITWSHEQTLNPTESK